MTEAKGKGEFYIVLILAIIVLAISVWAFIKGIHAPAQGDAVQGNVSVGEAVQGEEDGVDTETLAKEALASIPFATELSLMEDAVAKSMISVANSGTKVELYLGAGTCSDELLVVTAPDAASIKAEVENVQKHLTDMQQSFLDYRPKEAKKIDDAVILQTKNYIVACVSSDKEKAKSVLERLLQS